MTAPIPEFLPVHALKAMIINTALRYLGKEPHPFNIEVPDANEVDELWNIMLADVPDTMQDARNEVRGSGTETGLAVPFSRHMEPEAHAVLTPYNQWVGYTYWTGGGKHSNPEEISWMDDSYWVQAELDQVLRLENKFSSPDGKPEPYDRTTMADFARRLECMNAFCAPVTTESMMGQNVYSWINTESQKLIATMGEDAAAGVGPMSAFKKAFGEGPVSGVVAQLFAAEFMDTPDKNYIELVYNTPEMGNFTVTIQKHDHKTPGQRIAEVEDEREVLLAQLKDTVAAYEKGDDVFGDIERARQLIAKLEAK